MSNKSFKSGFCVYCGKYACLTKDHIPPNNLFSSPKPKNLITVPCCFECNNAASKDDEYFRLVFTTRNDIFNYPDAYNNWPAVKRSLSNPRKTGFRKAILNSIKEIYLNSIDGDNYINTGLLRIDMKRIKRIPERITRGLFYKEIGIRIPDKYKIHIISSSEMYYLPEEVKTMIQNELNSELMKVEPRVFGINSFSYRWIHSDEDINVSAWLLEFYGSESFLCTVID